MQPISEATARTWVDVDLGRLAANLRALKVRAPESDVLMVVKANGYGHGAVPVAKAAVDAGVWGLAVAALDEAAELRAGGVTAPVVCLMPVLPVEADRVVELGVTASVSDFAQADALAAAAGRAGRTIPVHLDVDTGMGRSGVWDRDGLALAERVAELQGLTLDGIFTHFSSSDDPDRSPTEQQLDRFDAFLAALEARGIRPPRVHAANSAAALRFGRAARALVRPGIALYGAVGEFALSEGDADPGAFRPILAWHARVLAVKDLAAGDSVSYHRRYVADGAERIAVLGVGYGDGWPWGLSGRGHVLLRGRPAPIRGAVCMDLTMVDATPFPDLAPGEVATLIGATGDARRTVEEIGREAGLMSYAVFTGISSRVRRRYVTSAEDADA